MEPQHSTIDQLSALLDGELDPLELAEVERHLADCERCQAELESLRATVMRLGSLPLVAPPRSFVLPVESDRPVMVARRRPWQRPELLRMFAGMAAALMLVVVVVDSLQPPAATFTASSPAVAPLSAPAAVPRAPADPAAQRSMESAGSESAGGSAGEPQAAPAAAAPAPGAPPAPALQAAPPGSTAAASVATAVPPAPDTSASAGPVRAFSVEQPARGPGVPQVGAVLLGALAVILFLASFMVRRA